MSIISVMGVIYNISRQFFSTLAGEGSRSHDFDDKLKISFLIFSRSKTFIIDLIFGFTPMGYSVLYLEIWKGWFQFYLQNN